MTKHVKPDDLTFYLTAPTACAYLPGQRERKVFAHLNRRDNTLVHDALTHVGFRRSQDIIYRPACDACDACKSARTPTAKFSPSRSQKRILKRNADIMRRVRAPYATQEQFALLDRYLHARHEDGGMAGMQFWDYLAMAGDTPVDTQIVEYRLTPNGALAGTIITDRLADGFSLVYSFFDPDLSARSLGTFMVLDQIARARDAGLDFVYLGYWVAGSEKMDYKSRFRPFEVLGRSGWRQVSED